MKDKVKTTLIINSSSDIAQVKRIAKKRNGAFVLKQNANHLVSLEFEFENAKDSNNFTNEVYNKVTGIEDHIDD